MDRLLRQMLAKSHIQIRGTQMKDGSACEYRLSIEEVENKGRENLERQRSGM